MKKLTVFLGMLLLSIGTICAQATNVPLGAENPQDPTGGKRSILVEPEVTLDGTIITINYPLSTTSQVIIRDADTGTVVYSAPYDATRQVVINLSSLPEGTYELRLYAFGKWWWGEFTIEIN